MTYLETPNQRQYRSAIEAMLSRSVTRIFLWRLIVEDCKVFEESYPMNASAYSLLAIQSIGKRLLADAKAVDAAAVFKAEQEYNQIMQTNQDFNLKGETDGEQQ
jgi:hypothetical protein